MALGAAAVSKAAMGAVPEAQIQKSAAMAPPLQPQAGPPYNPVVTLMISAITAVFARHMDRFLVGVAQWREGARVAQLIMEAIDKGDGSRAAWLIRANLEGWLEIAEREHPHILDAVVSWDS